MPKKKTPAARDRRASPSGNGHRVLDLGLLKDGFGFRFRRIQDHLSDAFRAQVTQRNIKSGVFSILALIAANPGISQTELQRVGGYEKTQLVGLIDGLEKEGLASRSTSTQDRRRNSLFISEKGSALLTELHGMLRVSEAAWTNRMNPKDLAKLSQILDQIYALFDDLKS